MRKLDFRNDKKDPALRYPTLGEAGRLGLLGALTASALALAGLAGADEPPHRHLAGKPVATMPAPDAGPPDGGAGTIQRKASSKAPASETEGTRK
jgi:hypothetical protein